MKNELNRKDNVIYNMMALPGLVVLILFSYIPMAGLVIAFQNYRFDKGIFKSQFIYFKNFEFFFSSQDAWRILYNTLTLNLLFIFLGISVAVIFALFLFQINKKMLIKTYQTTMLLPYFLSWVVVGIMSYAFLSPQSGVINQIFKYFGFGEIDWYSKPEYWPYILAFFSIWKNVGINCIIYYSGLLGIDSSLFEAAELDGANSLQKTLYISLPSIKTLIILMILMALGGIFRSDFGLFYQLTRDIGKLYPTTDVIDTYIFRALKSNGDVGMSAAVGLFQSFVGFGTILLANMFVRKIEKESALF